MSAKHDILTLAPEIKAFGLSDADVEALGGNNPVTVVEQDAFRQGLIEAAGEPNPTFPPDRRELPQYTTGQRVISLVNLDKGSQV